MRDLWVINATGTPLVSATINPIPKIDLSDRDYFRVHRDNAKAGTYVSEVLKARAADTSFFTLSRRREDTKNSFAGVTTISIAPEYFTNFYEKLPPPGVFALIRDDGAILCLLSRHLVTACKTLARQHRDAQHCQQSNEGFVTGTSTFDGHTRLFAYRKMPHYNIYVVSGIPSEIVIHDWLRNMTQPSGLRSAGDDCDDRAWHHGAAAGTP